ncbi:hypothetical protein lbkm_3797 [Lachnospiraceae bacterium KM106-2]|nr:hypothetical protein lbkm_3797 [Lachnospiraceae bacterium KM106-2]
MTQKEKKIISIFKKYGATDRKSSQSLKVLKIERTDEMNELIHKGILVGMGGDRYYLNLYRLANKNKKIMKWVQWIIGIVLVVIIIILLRM